MKIPILPLLEKNEKMPLQKVLIEELNSLGHNHDPFLFIIDFEALSPMVYRLNDIPPEVRYSFPGPHSDAISSGLTPDLFLKRRPVSFEIYQKAFDQVMFHLKQGNSYLVNLTFPTPVETSLSLTGIFERSEAPFKLLVDKRFVVFSPEPFIRIRDGMISAYPMKGTIDASIPNAEARVLMDPKESAEHNTIVDLIRNDLSKVANQVEVIQYRYIERLKTLDKEILQVSSEIQGKLPDGYESRIGDILNDLLPAGSVSGAPKIKTLEIIREAEQQPRGFYTGVFGIFDGKNLDSAVMIRYIEETESGRQYRSGGGITHLSDPLSEYRELVDKVYLHIKREN